MPLIHIDVHYPADTAQLDRIERSIAQIFRQGTIMAKELDELQAEVERNTSVDQSAIALLNGLAAKIDALKNDPAKLAALANSMRNSSDSLAAAVAANTPAEDAGGTNPGGGTPAPTDNT